MNGFPYLLPVLALLTSSIAIFNSKYYTRTKNPFKALTPWGWVLIWVAVLICIVSLSKIRDQEAANAERQRQLEQITSVAHTELRQSVQSILDPFYYALFKLNNDSSKYIAPPIDLIPKDVDMLDPEIRSTLVSINLNEQSAYGPINGKFSNWANVFQTATNFGSNRIDRSIQKYNPHISSDVIYLFYKLQMNDFFIYLSKLGEIVSVSNEQTLQYQLEQNPSLLILEPSSSENIEPFPFFFAELHPVADWGYEEFWDLIMKIDTALVKEID